MRAAHFLTHLEFDLGSPVWNPWLVELSRQHKLVRYDARGCGLSDLDSAPQTLDAWVADLEAVVDAAGLERFALLGCSQGCAVSIAYAIRHPERVSCLVVLGGYSRGPMRRDPTPAQIKEAKLMLDLIELGWGRDNPAFRQVFTSQFIPDGSPEQVHWFNELERLSTSPAHAARIVAAFGQIDVTESAARITCPTLVLHARGDARVPRAKRVSGFIRCHAESTQDAGPDTEAISARILPGSGHLSRARRARFRLNDLHRNPCALEISCCT